MHIEKYLQEIGFSDKESAIYLALLQVDNASILDLAKKTNINRTTIYFVIESLTKKGLVSEIRIGKKIHFAAEAPERLETYIERQKTILEEHSRRLKDMLPEIKAVQRELGERPVVKYFEGREGIISSLEEFYSTPENGGEVFFVYPKDHLDAIFTGNEMDRYRKLRLEKKARSKVLYTYTKGDKPSDATGDRIKIDTKKYPISCDIAIYKDCITINILGKKLSGIFIRSKDLADTLWSVFSIAFDALREKEEGKA